ncbi:MAG: CDP-archaeol synthase [Steroidobacteraceae bacterium]
MASGLRQRIFTALLLAAIVIGVLSWLPPGAAVFAVVVAMLAGAWEWAGFCGWVAPARRGAYVAAVGVAIALAWWLTAAPAALEVFLCVAALWWLIAFLWLAFAGGTGGQRAAVAVGFAVLVPAAIGLARLALVEPHGPLLLLYLLVLIAAADVGAYFGGRSFGRHKLAPRVSPGKTWEGFVAGMLGAVAAALLGARLFELPLLPWVAVCVLVALVSVVGDLFESLFKRRVGLKDSGNLLPGHGGVLDRLDSLTAAGPVFLLGLHLIGVAG